MREPRCDEATSDMPITSKGEPYSYGLQSGRSLHVLGRRDSRHYGSKRAQQNGMLAFLPSAEVAITGAGMRAGACSINCISIHVSSSSALQ
mmetsp:Transcript_57641/g.132348  ORF Transcript_57641/g.132348 Transcript_57641/m.132348 type:complete len:91 (-) Transcript_57641:175-447(-)